MEASSQAGSLREVAEAALAVRLAVRIAIAVLAVGLGLWKGPKWAVGVLAGGLLIEANLDLLVSMVKKSKPGPLAVPLWVTMVKFNLAFVATMAACVLVVKFRLGDPLAFLLGLLVFLPALVAGLFRYGSLKRKAALAQAPVPPSSASASPQAPPPSPPSPASSPEISSSASEEASPAASSEA